MHDDDDDDDDKILPHSESPNSASYDKSHDMSINGTSNVTVVAHESTGPSTTSNHERQQKNTFKEHYRQQQEEIVNRLHKAVTDNLKLINQNTDCNHYGGSKQDELCSNRAHNVSLSGNSGRFAVRNFNGNSSSAELKMCRLNKSKLSNHLTGNHQHQQHHHQTIANDLFSSLIDNDDDHNNNNNSNLMNDDSDTNNGNYLLPCPLCEIPLEPRVFRQHLDRHYPRDSPICPVLQCGRRFAHPNSVRNHMRLKHTLQWNRMKSMRSSGGPFSSIPY